MTRLQAQTRAIRAVNGVVLCVFGLAVGSLAVATAIPQVHKRAEKELELARVLDRERQVIAEKDDRKASYEALRDDPEYLEIHARDRLDLYRPGEKIFRIERDR